MCVTTPCGFAAMGFLLFSFYALESIDNWMTKRGIPSIK